MSAESSAWIERMVWRNVLMMLFVVGIVLCVVDFDHWWVYLPLIVGGLGPGLFLMAREQGERLIEENRRRLTPEGRHGADLPPRGALRTPPTPPYGMPAVPRYGPDEPLDDEDDHLPTG